MGHGSSRSLRSSDASAGGEGSAPHEPGRFTRFRRRLRLRLRRHCSNPDPLTGYFSAENFAGIVCFKLVKAKMEVEESKDKWFACLALGERTYKTPTSEYTDTPEWNSKKKVVLEKGGPHIARISVFETNMLSKNNLVGYCEVDLREILSREVNSDEDDVENSIEEEKLLNPSSPSKTVGTIYFSCFIEDPLETEQSFAQRVLALVDYDEDGMLSLSEFKDLIDAFGNQIAADKAEELFNQVDENKDGVVSVDELAALLTVQQEKENLISSCPVCNETLSKFDRLNAIIHLTLCFDEGTGNQIMTGGFLTDKQASYGWMFKLSEWVHFSSYNVGLKSGSSAAHILVIDRRSGRLVEELIDGKIILSMRAIYQSRIGLKLIDKGAKDLLTSISEKQGKKMDSPESAKEITKFIEFFKDQVNTDEIKHDLEQFKTFNEFFIRELKPGARPIAFKECPEIAVCAADSRLMAFKSVNDSSRLWIKGRKFSIKGLLGDAYSSSFDSGSIVIFRLAPQDYHRFHFPVAGIVERFVEISGCLYTVNPIAVNSKYCNVFTENKRIVAIISTTEFGKVTFIAIGATMVGSINFVRNKGDHVEKGDEFGYFSFGGSTVICVFEKDAIEIDEDLIDNSGRSLETLVQVGMSLGKSRKSLLEGTSLPIT